MIYVLIVALIIGVVSVGAGALLGWLLDRWLG